MAENETKYATVALCWKPNGSGGLNLDTAPLVVMLDDGYEIVRADVLPGCPGMEYGDGCYDRRIPSALVYILRKRD